MKTKFNDTEETEAVELDSTVTETEVITADADFEDGEWIGAAISKALNPETVEVHLTATEVENYVHIDSYNNTIATKLAKIFPDAYLIKVDTETVTINADVYSITDGQTQNGELYILAKI